MRLRSGRALRLLLRFVVVVSLVGEAESFGAAAALGDGSGRSGGGQLSAGGSSAHPVGSGRREVLGGGGGSARRYGAAVEIHGGAVVDLEFDACKRWR